MNIASFSIISTIFFICLIVGLSPFLGRILRIPATPIEIALGSVGAYFGLVKPENMVFKYVAEFGFLFLMFIAGMEIDLKFMLKLPRKILLKTGMYIVLLYVFSVVFVKILGLSNIFILIFPLISVGLITGLSKEYGAESAWIKLAFIAGVFGEVVSIGGLTISSSMLHYGIGMKFYKAMAILLAFLLLVVFLFRLVKLIFWRYPKIKLSLMPHFDKQEQDIRLSMMLFFLMLVVCLFTGIEMAFGTFIAGIMVVTFFAHKENLPHKMASFGFGFLVPIFFVNVGSNFVLEALTIDGLVVKTVEITLCMILMRFLASLVFVKEYGLKVVTLMAFCHSMPLTLLIAVATLAHTTKSIDMFHFYALILSALFEVFVALFAVKIISSK